MVTQIITQTMPAYLAASPKDYARLGIAAHNIAPFEDGSRTDGEPGTYEWWYFDAHLDDGSKLVVVFSTKAGSNPSGPLTPKISINLNLADGRSIEKILVTGVDQFQTRTDACDVRIAGNRFSGDLHTYRIQATIENVSVDVELIGQVPAWRPKSGHWYFGDGAQPHLFVWLPSVPQGQVRACYAAGDDVYVMTFKRQKTILRNKLIETLPQDKKAAAAVAGFDGVYVRFTGDFTLTQHRQGATVVEITEPALWEMMYFGHTRQPNA